MARRWPKDLAWIEVVLTVDNARCGECGRRMHVCDYRHHRLYTLKGPLHLVCKLVRCAVRDCPNHHRTFSPERELALTMPRWLIGWDVFCWLGHRRFARHWSVPQLRAELLDSHNIVLSEDSIEDYLQRYQCVLAARQQDPVLLKKEYQKTRHLLLSIDGLQPEKGHETLYVVRELGQQRVWFAHALGAGLRAPTRDRLPGHDRERQRLVANQGLVAFPAPRSGLFAAAFRPLRGSAAAASGGADRVGSPAASLPGGLDTEPEEASTRAGDLPAAQQRPERNDAAGPELAAGSGVAQPAGAL